MISQSSEQQKTSADYRSCFPNFLWLLRDVSLKVPENKTPQQYIMDTVFTQNKAVGEAIMTLFPSFDCRLLSSPNADPDILGDIENHESELETRFMNGVASLIDHLQESIEVKHGFSHGHRVDGSTLVLLLEQYLEAVNTPGTVPCLQNTWNTVVEMRCSQVINGLVKEYEDEMEIALRDKLPVEEEATPREVSDPDQRQQQVFLMEVHSQILRSKEEKLLKEMKYVTPAKNVLNPSAATQYKKELVKRLQSQIIEAKFDEMKGQIVTGGVILQFIRENYEKSHARCVECFNECSAPVMKILQSIKESDPETAAAPDAPRYTFQQFLEDRANLQVEYDARAVGPAKQKVWEEKLSGLKELEPLIKKLDGYQKKVHEDHQRLAELAIKKNELKDQVSQQKAYSSRLESDMDHLQTRLTQEHEENLQQAKDDAAKMIEDEKKKAEDLKNRKEIKEKELAAALQKVESLEAYKKKAEQQQQQQLNDDIKKLQDENETIKKANTSAHDRLTALEKGVFIVIVCAPFKSANITCMH